MNSEGGDFEKSTTKEFVDAVMSFFSWFISASIFEKQNLGVDVWVDDVVFGPS
jgi:hypothetical protein